MSQKRGMGHPSKRMFEMWATRLTATLASKRSDKPNPLYYAQRTIDIASARLMLLNGSAIKDVIDMMENRRSGDVPAAFCSSRAREIASTAQRMIERSMSSAIVRTKGDQQWES